MNSAKGKPSESAPYGNRSSDRVSTNALVENEADMLVLLEAYRLKEISADSVSGSVDVAVLFGWLVNGTVTQTEFDELVDSQSVQEIVLGKDSSADPLSEEPPELALIEGLRAKIAAYPEKESLEALTSAYVSEWSNPGDDAASGLGVVMRFEKKEEDKEGPAVSFTLEMRTGAQLREGGETVRAEVVFSGYDKF